MFDFKDDDILSTEQLSKMINENPDYINNEYLKYLIDNQIIAKISYGNFKKLWKFISRKDIYNVYDYGFLNLICKNIILFCENIEEYIDEEDLENPEKQVKIRKLKSTLQSFYEIIDNGNLKKFDSLINILMGNNKDQKEKIKVMIDTVSNFNKYIPLAEEIIEQGTLDYKEKYALIELLKLHPEFEYDYEEYERNFYPDDEIINGITTLEDLKKFVDTCHEVQVSRIKALQEDDFYGDEIFMVKNEIVKLLTNIKYYGENSLDTIGFETPSLKNLRKSISDEAVKDELSKYILFMSLIDSILKFEDLRKLKIIACRISDFKYNNDNIYTIYKYTEQMVKRIKEIYAYEIKEKLLNFNELKIGNNQLYSRVNSKFTADSKMLYDEDITGRKVDYIELSGIDYVLLVHVLNAYGTGGTLKDFKTPRIIGKEYICLSAIDETKKKIAKTTQSDEEHVCLLFSDITPDQLISESFEDLYSSGDLNSLSITSEKRENFRTVRKQIQLNKDRHTEFILYRYLSNGEPIYPSGILIQNDTPTQAEINAAAYLNVPIVFINQDKYKNKSNNDVLNVIPNQVTSEDYKIFKESLIELRDSINGRGKGR